MKYNKEMKEILNTITKDFYLLKGFLSTEEATKKVFENWVDLVVFNHKEKLIEEYAKENNLIKNNFDDFMNYLKENNIVFDSVIFNQVKGKLGDNFYDFLTPTFDGVYITTAKLEKMVANRETQTLEEIKKFVIKERNAQIELLKGQKIYTLNLEINYKKIDGVKAFYINENYYQFLETEEGKTLEFVGREYIRKTDNQQDYIFNLIDINLNKEDIKAFNLSKGLKGNNYCFIDDELKFNSLSYSYLDFKGSLRFKKHWFYLMRYNTQTKEFYTHHNQKIDFNILLIGASEKTKNEFWEIINHAKELIERGSK